MGYKINEINYKDYISNDIYREADDVEIKLLFVPYDVALFETHNYRSEITIFDYKIDEYLKKKMLTSYENDNPLTRSDNVFFEDENGDLEYQGKKYKNIDNLIIYNADCIPIYAFSNYRFNDVSIINTRMLDACAFLYSVVDSLYIDNNIKIIGFNALPRNLKIIDGYYDIKDNSKLILAKVEDVAKPIISNDTKIIYQGAAIESKNIEELIIPDGVTMIGSRAFYECENIKVILLPKSLVFIDERAFDKTNAKDVFYDGALEDWDKIEIIDEDWSYREWLDRAVLLHSSPRKDNNNFYVLDPNGKKLFNGKKYRKVANK